MTTALLLEADASTQTQESGPDFGQRHPLQIAMCLRNLTTRGDFVTVEFGRRQIVTQVLDVDSRNGTFTFDLGNIESDNAALLDAGELTFRSLPGGIQTRFTTGAASKVRYDERPAFEAQFPAVLYYVQRREFFRVQTPVLDPFVALGVYADGGRFRLELQDLSLGGIALRSYDARFADAENGRVLTSVVLQLGHFGSLSVDLEIVAPRQSTTPKGDVRYVLGCRFVGLSGAAERVLQRVVTQLETKRQTLARG
ncbi:flagellar brake protein [Paraburkholderia sp.]|uniref:flagellar brake protein n=1 Tax=Paraburkholderia sp. TaxID=1926495 RepID=UPI0023A6CE4E|nr:flagellar brake protein [Paraburkholderia sp.]MDE1179132.1 flagellar brake protein [Paraburkholderia sp.]